MSQSIHKYRSDSNEVFNEREEGPDFSTGLRSHLGRPHVTSHENCDGTFLGNCDGEEKGNNLEISGNRRGNFYENFARNGTSNGSSNGNFTGGNSHFEYCYSYQNTSTDVYSTYLAAASSISGHHQQQHQEHPQSQQHHFGFEVSHQQQQQDEVQQQQEQQQQQHVLHSNGNMPDLVPESENSSKTNANSTPSEDNFAITHEQQVKKPASHIREALMKTAGIEMG